MASFQRNGFHVVSLGRPGEPSQDEAYPGVAFGQASGEGLFPHRYGPRFADILAQIPEETAGGIVNADIYMPPSRVVELLHASPGFVFAARRLDVDGMGGDALGIYRRGIDGLFFAPGTIGALRDDAALGQLQLGAPYWDIAIPVVASFHHHLRFLPAPFLCHPIHAANWNEDDYRRLRTHAVRAVVDHAERIRGASPRADAFLEGLGRYLLVRKARTPERREKRTAEYMGRWLALLERDHRVDLTVDFNDPYIRRTVTHLMAHSNEGLLLGKMLDEESEDVRWPALLQATLRAFRKTRRFRRGVRGIDQALGSRSLTVLGLRRK